jgi:hypothetical protein
MTSKNHQYLFSCFLWFQEEVFKVKKIPDPDPQHCVTLSEIHLTICFPAAAHYFYMYGIGTSNLIVYRYYLS